jgi:hypothetical protein
LITRIVILAAGFAATVQSARPQPFSITNFSMVLYGPRTAQFSADAASYYILYSGTIVTNVAQPVAMALGIAGSLSLQDPSPQVAARFYLNGPLAVGQYLVVASTNLTGIAVGARVVYFPAGDNNIQNGAPDGLALINTGALTIHDAFCYEGAMTAANIIGFTGTRSLVEGTALSASVADSNTVLGSLARLPDGTDKNNASADWSFTSTPTPGAANVP